MAAILVHLSAEIVKTGEFNPYIWYVSRKRLYFGPTMYKVKVQQTLAVSVVFVETVFSRLISVYLDCSTS